MDLWSTGVLVNNAELLFGIPNDNGMKVDTAAGVFRLTQYSSTPLLQHSTWVI